MKKTLSFAVVHFTVAFTLGYLLTGSVLVGGALALIEPACNTVAYHLHERIWSRWERASARGVGRSASGQDMGSGSASLQGA